MINPLHPLARGLVGCWLINEGNGSLANDISGYKNHGIFKEGTSWSSSHFGGGLYVDGGDNWVDCGANSIFDSAFGTNRFTISIWVKRLQLNGYQGIINKRDSYYYSASPGGLFMDSNGSTLRFVIGTGYESQTYDSLTTVTTLNGWHHIVAVADGTYMYLYKDGLLVGGPSVITKNPPTNTDNVTIGCQLPEHREFRGIIDEVIIYNRGLSYSEVKQLYQDPFAAIKTPSVLRLYAPADEPAAEPKPTIPTATKPKPGATINILDHINTGLVGYWLMNEGSGSNIYDISGKGNHGTLTNMSTNDQSSGWSGSKFGGGLGFDGTDDYINCGDDSSLSMTNVITISAWVKTNTLTAYQDISHKGVHTAQHEGMYFGLDNNGKYGLYLGNGTSSTHGLSSDNITTEWNHIAATWDGTTIRLYKNGIQDPSTYLFSGPIYYGSGVFTIGRAAWGGYYFDGILDEIQIYNRRLDTNELKQQYHNPFGGIITPSVLRLYTPAAPVGWAGTINGVTNPTKIYGIPVANIVKVSGVA